MAEKKGLARGIQEALDASKKASDTTMNKVRARVASLWTVREGTAAAAAAAAAAYPGP